MPRPFMSGPAPRTRLPGETTPHARSQSKPKKRSERASSSDTNPRQTGRLRMLETLESRCVFAAPTLAAISNVTLNAGAPLQIGLDGFDADNDSLTYTVTSSNPSVLANLRSSTNRSLQFNVTHASSGAGDPAFTGSMIFELYDDLVPGVTNRIAELAESGFYDGVLFHRVINNFVIQAGRKGVGQNGMEIGSGVSFDDLFHPDLQHTGSGLLSMAKTNDDTNDSQFFVTEGLARHLDFNHSIFGMLTEGENIRALISDVKVTSDVPDSPVTITSASIIVDTQNKALTLKAPVGFSGTTTITVQVSDGHGGTATQTFTVTVQADTTNNNPYLISTPTEVRTTANTAATFTLQSNEIDDATGNFYDGILFDNNDSGKLQISVNETTGLVTLTPLNNFTGVVTILVAVGNQELDVQAIPVFIAPAAPTSIDLLPGSDTGGSDTDNLTNLNNSDNAHRLTFRVSGVTSGTKVQLYDENNLIGEGIATGTTIDIVTNGTFTLPNELHSITAKQVLLNQAVAAGNDIRTVDIESNASTAIPLLVDTVGPQFTSVPPATLNAGSTYTYDAQTNDEGQTGLIYSLVSGPVGMTIDPASGVVSWIPTAQQLLTLTHNAEIRATDLAGNNSLQDFTIALNSPPVIATIGNKTINGQSLLQFTVSVTDPNIPNDTFTYSLDAGFPAGAGIDSPTGTFQWTPAANQIPGTFTVTVRATDAGGLSDTETFEITTFPENFAPTLNPIDDVTISESDTLTFTVVGNDANLPNDTLRYSIFSSPGNASINPVTGVFTYTPHEQQGGSILSFAIRVTDAGGLFATETFEVEVLETNSAPILVAIPNQTVNAGQQLTVTPVATDPDLPAQQLSYTLDFGPNDAIIDPLTGVIQWTPGIADGIGPIEFQITVEDGDLTATRAFSVTVNQAPSITSVPTQIASEESQYIFTLPGVDPNVGDALTYTVLTGLPIGMVLNSSSGLLTWTPSETQGGSSASATFRVTDQGGLFSERTIDFTVVEVNTSPSLQAISNQILNAGTQLTINLVGSDTDLPAQTLQYFIDSGPAGATVDIITGELNWTVPDGQTGITFDFQVRVSDGDLSEARSFQIAVNVPPEITAVPALNVPENAPFSLTLNVTDLNAGDTRAFTATTPLPAGMTLNAQTGQLNWTPDETQGGLNFSFTVRVTDSGGLFAETTIQGTVAETASAPVAANLGPFTINEGQTASFFASFTDSDLPVTPLTFQLISGPAGGTFNAATGQFSWTAGEAHGGTAQTVVIRATDSTGLTADQTVTINVLELNELPVLTVPANATVDELTQFTLQPTTTDSDLPAQSLTYSLLNAPAGMGIDPATGLVTWTPTEAQGAGAFAFSIRVTDSLNGAATRAVTVTVNEVNTAPSLATNTPSVEVLQGQNLTAFTYGTDADAPTQQLIYSLDDAPAGLTINSATGALQWNTDFDSPTGLFIALVRVTDSFGEFATLSINIVVNEFKAGPFFALFPQGNLTNVNTINLAGPTSVEYGTARGAEFVSLNPLIIPPSSSSGEGMNEGLGRLQAVRDGVELASQKPVIEEDSAPNAEPKNEANPNPNKKTDQPNKPARPMINPFGSSENSTGDAPTNQQSRRDWHGDEITVSSGPLKGRKTSAAQRLRDWALNDFLRQEKFAGDWLPGAAASVKAVALSLQSTLLTGVIDPGYIVELPNPEAELPPIEDAGADAVMVLEGMLPTRFANEKLAAAEPVAETPQSDRARRLARYDQNSKIALTIAAGALAAPALAANFKRQAKPQPRVPRPSESLNKRRGSRYWFGK